ncbi:MAG: hypothetical protein V2A73_14670 [Pseudomonadota bacterium]
MMRRSVCLGGLCLAQLLVLGCGNSGGEVSIDELFPENNELAGWIEDTSVGFAGVEVYTSSAAAEEQIDGDVEPFEDHSFRVFARQHYVKDALKVELRLWKMPDAATAEELYDDLLVNDAKYSAYSWTDIQVGEAGRVANRASLFWWVNARKGLHYTEATINQPQPDDQASRQEAINFVTALLQDIP